MSDELVRRATHATLHRQAHPRASALRVALLRELTAGQRVERVVARLYRTATEVSADATVAERRLAQDAQLAYLTLVREIAGQDPAAERQVLGEITVDADSAGPPRVNLALLTREQIDASMRGGRTG